MAKEAGAFRTIGEVAEDLDLPQHVLRFWESRFPQIDPLKRSGGRRYYRPEQVAVIATIRDLLYRDGYTIKGVQRLLKAKSANALRAQDADQDAAPVPERSPGTTSAPPALPGPATLSALADEIDACSAILASLRARAGFTRGGRA